jgi:hypothetical protein
MYIPKRARLFAMKIECQFTQTPESQLIYHIFTQTAKDLADIDKIKEKTPQHVRDYRERNYNSAINFFAEDGAFANNFNIYCENINIDPKWIRLVAKKLQLI